MQWRRGAIIGLGLLLAGCSALRLGYGQAPHLAWWWLDDYLAFEPEQAPRVREALGQWLAWHRRTQLADYAGLLARMRGDIDAPVDAARICRWNDELRARLTPMIEQVLPAAAEIAPLLTAAQLRHLESRHAKANDKFRREQVQDDPSRRRESAIERLTDRYESFYGPLDSAQQRLLAEAVAASPYEPHRWLEDRRSAQAELVATLRRIAAERPDPRFTQALLRALVHRFDGTPQGPLQVQRQRLTWHHCETLAKFHAGTTPAQRQHLRRKLSGWESDLRALVSDAPAAHAAGREPVALALLFGH